MNVAGLPHDRRGRLAVDGCELNERLDPVGPAGRQEARGEAVRTVVAVAITAAVLGVVPRLVVGVLGPGAPDVLLLFAGGTLLLSGFHALAASRFAAHFLRLAALFLVLWIVCRVQAGADTAADGHQMLFSVGVLGAGALSHLVAKQYAHYTAANVLNDWATGNLARATWAALERGWTPGEPPEVTCYRRAAYSLAVAYLAGLGAPLVGVSGVVVYLVALFALASFAWPKDIDVLRAAVSCGHAVQVFLTYDRVGAKAPGVFRFPSAWIRPWYRRGMAICFVFTVISAAVATELPSVRPANSAQPYFPDRDSPVLTADEREYLDSVSDPEDRAAYCQVLKARREHEARIRGEIDAAYDSTLWRVALACLVLPTLVVAATLVFLTGPILSAYNLCLELREES